MERGILTVDGRSGAAIQAALDAAGAQGGAVVRLEPGRYVLEGPLLLDSDTTLVGAGPSLTTLVLAPGTGTNMIENRSAGARHLAIRSIALDGNGPEQERRPGSVGHVWACGACLRTTHRIRVVDVVARRIRQTAFHFNECRDVVVDDLLAEDVGWSGVSSSGTDAIVLRSVTVRRAGLDVKHSGIHLDGGTGAYVDALVEDVTGNAIMIDSTFAAMADVVVRGTGRRAHRGVSLSGSLDHPLRNVLVTGAYTDNVHVGVLVSNAEQVFVVDATLARNGEHGVLLRGSAGAQHCVVADCTFDANPVAIGEVDRSTSNFLPASGAARPPAPAPAPWWKRVVRAARRLRPQPNG